MGVRVWGVVEDRLIEIRANPRSDGLGMSIEGLPADRARATADRVRAALLNSGLVPEAPSVLLRAEPTARGRRASDLDVPLAVAALVAAGVIRTPARWVLATGRLGLDGSVHAPGLDEPVGLADVVGRLCRTRMIGFERMFGRDG